MAIESAMDRYEQKPIGPGIWLIDDYNGDSMYLIEGEKKALLIDTGMGTGDLSGLVRSLTKLPLEVVVAHGHGDHAGQAHQFGKAYMPLTEMDILTERWPHIDPSSFMDIKEGSVFDLGGKTLEVISVPGHTPGSIVLLDKQDRILFTSDAVGSGFVWMHITAATTLSVYLESLKKLEARKGEYDRLFTGHYNQTNGRQLTQQYVTDMRILVEKLLGGEIIGQPYPLGREDDGYIAYYGSAAICYATDKFTPDETADRTKYTITEIDPGVYCIKDRNPVFKSNMFLVMGSKKALLIDTGIGSGDLKSTVQNLIGSRELVVVVTHGHGDHSGQISQFEKVYIPEKDIPVLKARWPEMVPSTFADVKDGDSFDLGGRMIRVIGLKGHTPGHVTLLDEQNGLLFTGDAIGTRGDGGGVWMHYSELYIDEYLEVLKKFKARVDGKFTKIFTGHNSKPILPGYLDYVIAAAQKIVDNGESVLVDSIRPEGYKMIVYGDKDDPCVASINVNPNHLLSKSAGGKQ